MSYQSLQVLASAASATIFLTVIVVMLVYAFWPGNAQKFERAARQPLEDDAPLR